MSRIIGSLLFVGIAMIGVSFIVFARRVDPDHALKITFVPALEPAPAKQIFEAQLQLDNRSHHPIDVHSLTWC